MEPNQQEHNTQTTETKVAQNTTAGSSQSSTTNAQPSQTDVNPKNLVDPFSLFKKPVFVVPLIISVIIFIVGQLQPNENIKTMCLVPMVVIMPIIAGVLIIRIGIKMSKNTPPK